jgi:hypothetical protein
VQRQTGEKAHAMKMYATMQLGLPSIFPAVTSFGSFPMKRYVVPLNCSSFLALSDGCQTFFAGKKL